MTKHTNETTDRDEPTTDQPTTSRDPLADDFDIGDPVVDLANGRNMVVVGKAADRADDWSDENGYDLLGNYGNRRLRARPADPVYTCVYVAGLGSNPSKNYDFPSSRLGRPEYENAVDSGLSVYDLVARDLLESIFVEAMRVAKARNEGVLAGDTVRGIADKVVDGDVVDEAWELAELEVEWDPEPASLRDGETPDDDAHAKRNAEQLAMADTEGDDGE